MFERRERSERSEFGDGPQVRALQGSRSEAEAASDEAEWPVLARLCRPTHDAHGNHENPH